MTEQLSNDHRLGVVQTVENDLSRWAAAQFDVSIASAVCWHQRCKRAGKVDPDAVGEGRQSHFSEAQAARVLGD